MNRLPVFLLDGATRQPVSAELVEGLTLEDIQRADATWTPFLRQALRDALADGLAPDDLPEHCIGSGSASGASHRSAANSSALNVRERCRR